MPDLKALLGSVTLVVVAWGQGCASSVGVDDMPARAATAICGKVYECCQPAEVPSGHSFAPDLATCQTNFRTSLEGTVKGLKAEEARGRLTYHGDRLAECLERWKSATCGSLKSDTTSAFPPCDAYVEPRVAIGLSCRMNESCIGGQCSGQSEEADGLCVAFVAESQSCDTAPCGRGLYCDGAKVCRALKGEGAACNFNFECASGGCNGRPADGGTGTGTCGPKGGAGTTCFVASGCAAGGPELAAVGAVLLLLALAWPRRLRAAAR